MKIKFTKDGKKVSVVGKINSTQFICQEIYVDDQGNELPLGEKFTESNLLDAPIESWKEQNLRKLEDRYQKDKAEYERNIKLLRTKTRNQVSLWRDWVRQVDSTFSKFNIDIELKLKELLDPDYGYVVVGLGRYYSTKILKKEDWMTTSTGYEGKVKLFSLFGNSNGDVMWRYNTYTDTSGSWNDVLFFKTREEAIQCLQTNLNGMDQLGDSSIKIAKEYNLEIPKDLLKTYVENKTKSSYKLIEDKKAQIKKAKQEIEELKKSLEV